MKLLDLVLATFALVFFFAVAAPAGDGSDPPEVCRAGLLARSTRWHSAEATGRWWLWTDLNCRPNDYESFALTN